MADNPTAHPVKLTYYCDTARHLVCAPYSIENLHRMAADLGLKRHWFHPGRHPHYDIPVRRSKEIMARCTIVSTRRLLEFTKRLNNGAGKEQT